VDDRNRNLVFNNFLRLPTERYKISKRFRRDPQGIFEKVLALKSEK
jgi:hypothetical protein